MFPRTLIVC
ncbi:hypothetical protein M3Y94_00114500 [Aphelenchoides besseyi]|nr:hypothetical protein M3Y94_00114500 [Aphelenchoides besseyi]